MPHAPSPPSLPAVGHGRPARRGVAVWLAGPIGLDAWGAMQDRLAWDVSEPGGRPPTLVICEPERSITVDWIEPDASIAKTGLIALQIHGGLVGTIRYRNLRIKPLDAAK